MKSDLPGEQNCRNVPGSWNVTSSELGSPRNMQVFEISATATMTLLIFVFHHELNLCLLVPAKRSFNVWNACLNIHPRGKMIIRTVQHVLSTSVEKEKNERL